MEGLLEIIVTVFVQIIVAVFDPFTRLVASVWRAGKSFYNYFDPNNLPDRMTLDDLDVEPDETHCP